jgi:hypothetical protein
MATAAHPAGSGRKFGQSKLTQSGVGAPSLEKSSRAWIQRGTIANNSQIDIRIRTRANA